MAVSPEAPPIDVAALAPEASWRRDVGGIDVTFGPGCLGDLGAVAAALANGSVLLVTDRGLVAAGHARAARESLAGHGLTVHVFDEVSPNPTTAEVEAGTERAAEGSIGLIVGLGGGSAMDCAKGINFLHTNGGRMEDYQGYGKAARPMLPSLGVPTTAGTGSDAQSYALISHASSHRKLACGDPGARFRAVLLDPELLTTTPRRVAAAAGMDALSHALESFVSTARTSASVSLARRAFALLEPTLAAMAVPPAPTSARANALLGAHLAGAAIERSMLGAAHAAANPLTAHHGVPHGEAIGLVLPTVIRFNAEAVDDLYRELWPDGAEALATRVEAIRAATGLPTRLGEAGVTAGDPGALAASACDEWTGRFNPRPVDAAAFEEIYASAL